MVRYGLLLAALAGCHGEAARPAAAPKGPPAVTLCKTTEAELRAQLGEPTRDGLLHDARVLSWILGERGGVVRYLAVLLDANHVVVDRIWNVPTEIPWTPMDQCKP
ncbi:MAG: hypothetical protein KF773_06895 [Deltaproteobacteria bacterium]|nr:hypothetical protein [Deltaproteobacteria bacterium]MCW5803882.1 hypothetical protein [Deltaproteobacteria bacterium]